MINPSLPICSRYPIREEKRKEGVETTGLLPSSLISDAYNSKSESMEWPSIVPAGGRHSRAYYITFSSYWLLCDLLMRSRPLSLPPPPFLTLLLCRFSLQLAVPYEQCDTLQKWSCINLLTIIPSLLWQCSKFLTSIKENSQNLD